MQADVVDGRRRQACVLQGRCHGLVRSSAFGMGRCGVMGIAGEARAEQNGQGLVGPFGGQQEHARPFGHRQSLTGDIQGPATVAVDQLEGMKSEIGQTAERIDPARENTPHPAAPQQVQGQGNGHRP